MLDGSKLPDDPLLAWAILIIAFVGAVSPILVARMKDRAGKPDPPATPPAVTPQVVSPSQAIEVRHVEKPSLDAQSQLLVKMVEGLEKRAERAEQRNEAQQKQFEDQRREMQQRIDDLEGQLFAAQRTSDQQRQEIDTLRTEVRQLTQRLIARGSGG